MENWKKDLSTFLGKREKKKQREEAQLEKKYLKVVHFYKSVVCPALEELKTELEKYERIVSILGLNEFAGIRITYKDKEEYSYNIIVRIIPGCSIPLSLYKAFSKGTQRVPKKQVTNFRKVRKNTTKSPFNTHSPWTGGQEFDISEISNISKEDVIRRFLKDYKSYLRIV